MSVQTNDAYWKDVMENRRMHINHEVTRLSYTLLGFLYSHNEYCRKTKDIYNEMDALEFWDSKRPYGNKDIEMSIAFNLGWDYNRILPYSDLPQFVRDEAMKIHEMVKEELQLILE